MKCQFLVWLGQVLQPATSLTIFNTSQKLVDLSFMFWFSFYCSQPTVVSYTDHLHSSLHPPASHFLSNVMLIKIDPFPHRCSNRDTGDNDTPFTESAHAHWEEADHPAKEPSVAMFLVFLFTSQTIVLMKLHINHHFCIKLNLWSSPQPQARWACLFSWKRCRLMRLFRRVGGGESRGEIWRKVWKVRQRDKGEGGWWGRNRINGEDRRWRQEKRWWNWRGWL